MCGHDASVCCACGASPGMLRWVEHHRIRLPCSETLSREAWVRVREGIAPRPDSEGVAHSALLTLVGEREWLCQEVPGIAPCEVPKMRCMLVGGFHQRHEPKAWVLISLDGELTVDLQRAQLHPFTARGSGYNRTFLRQKPRKPNPWCASEHESKSARNTPGRALGGSALDA
jgi:hypothetical protein